MDANCTDKLILLVQANPVPYDKSAAGYKDDFKKGHIWRQIGVISERTIDLDAVSRFSVAV